MDHFTAAPTPRPWILFEHMGGAVGRSIGGDTSYGQRDCGFEVSVWGR